MAKTVEEGFNIFHSWLTPTGTESAAAKSHRASIEACLKANMGMARFFRTGSFGNGTSISGYSDVDYFASIPRKNLKQDSNKSLSEMCGYLRNRFPNTGVRVDSPAIIVPFGTSKSETTEVVMADFIERKSNCSTYEISDGNGNWILANPELHNAYVDYVNKKLNYKVKALIRFIKAWKFYRSVPISSFYLEMFVTEYASNEKTIVNSIDVSTIFSKLASSSLAPINDPMGISGSISACNSSTSRVTALTRIGEADIRSSYARTAERENRIADAFYWWNVVYNSKFPSY